MFKTFLFVLLFTVICGSAKAAEPTSSEKTFSVSSGLHNKIIRENNKDAIKKPTYRHRNYLRLQQKNRRDNNLQYFSPQRNYNQQSYF